MEFIVDKNLPSWIVALFEQYGHSAVHVDNCTYNKDKDILKKAQCLRRIVVTRDIGLKSRVIENMDNEVPDGPVPYPSQTKAEKDKPRSKFAKGVLMFGGSPKLTREELRVAVINMLTAMKTLSFAHAVSVDIMIDRDGICFKITEESYRKWVPKRRLNEIRLINDFDKKMAFFKEKCGIDYPAIIEDREEDVDGTRIKIPNNRFFLRQPLNQSTQRVDIASVAEMNIMGETNIRNMLKRDSHDFKKLVERETPPEKKQLVGAMLTVVLNPNSSSYHTSTNHKPGYVMPSKKDKIPQKRV